MIRPIIAVLVLLLAFGALRVPIEHAVSREHREAYFRGAQLGLGLREQLGQVGFLAALSGFRSVVADMLWIKAHTAWERTEWGRMAALFETITSLQPRVIMFWDMAAWHMAWNASVAALNDQRLGREALRVRAQRQYFELGRDLLERGIRNNPDRWTLHDRLAMLLRDKFEDHCAAAGQYARAAAFADAPAYEKRFAAYELSRCPGQERAAYEKLAALFDLGKKEQLPTLLSRLAEMEKVLGIPEADRRVPQRPSESNP